MKYKDIVELKKRMEFKMTEPETLVKLVTDAQNKGENVRRDMERLRNIASKLTKIFTENGLIFTETALKDLKLKYKRAVGIDGSFQLVGGAGGKWYVPLSIARIIFDNGLGTQPRVDVFWASIEELDEVEEYNPNRSATMMMLAFETEAIFNWGTLNKEAYVFIDGPIVDPPVIGYEDKDYIKTRCNAIKKCLETSIVVGCVKRSRDKFYINHLRSLTSEGIEKEYPTQFPSDQYLIAHIFSQIRSKGYYGPLFTRWIDISSTPISNDTYEAYKEEEVHIVCLFFQKDVRSQVLRIDIPFLQPPSEDVAKVDAEVMHIVKAVNEWTYPGQDYPVPVFLAHNKCNIREGCAEILYEEIMTRSRTTDQSDQIILSWLR
ncbi:MAG: hypothetical protein QXZ17_02760 [Nitrososphaerota archaeon]